MHNEDDFELKDFDWVKIIGEDGTDELRLRYTRYRV
jgi:hypothetical protein